MEPPFAAYVGDEPYVFVSYAHSDSNLIYPELSSFHEAHVNSWYDEGIEPGAEWREEIADAITHARLFLYFVTSSSIQSEHCKSNE